MYYSIQIFKIRVLKLKRNLTIGEKGRPNQVFVSDRYFNSKMRILHRTAKRVYCSMARQFEVNLLMNV